VRDFFDKKYAERLNPKTLKLIRAPINGILAYAVELELIESKVVFEMIYYKINRLCCYEGLLFNES